MNGPLGTTARRWVPAWLASDPGGAVADSSHMFIVELTYKVDLSEIDAHMAAHMTYLRKHYAAGTFVVSGRQIPRTGGVIVALGKTRAELEAILAEDPFHRHALADFRIIEFRASQHAKGLDALLASEVAATR